MNAESNIKTVNQWREALLMEVANAFARADQGQIQKNVAMWKLTDELPFPPRSAIRIHDGCLTFITEIGGDTVLFSTWMMFGEVRVGVQIPQKFCLKASKKLSEIYNGKPCDRQLQNTSNTTYDWVFTTGFADFACFAEAMDSATVRSMIGCRIADILTHIYMGVVNTLIEGNDLKVVFKVIAPKEGFERQLLVLDGSINLFQKWIHGTGELINVYPRDTGGVILEVEVRVGERIKPGEITVDGVQTFKLSEMR